MLDAQVIYRIIPTENTARVLVGYRKGCERRSKRGHKITSETISIDEKDTLKNAQAIAFNSKNGKLFVAESDGKRLNYVSKFFII